MNSNAELSTCVQWSSETGTSWLGADFPSRFHDRRGSAIQNGRIQVSASPELTTLALDADFRVEEVGYFAAGAAAS